MSIVLSIGIPLLSYLISPNQSCETKSSSYECGFEAYDDSRAAFDIHFFIVALLFIVFDIELAFLLP
jgi:NADH-quinone oxidoreductase subunit A